MRGGKWGGGGEWGTQIILSEQKKLCGKCKVPWTSALKQKKEIWSPKKKNLKDDYMRCRKNTYFFFNVFFYVFYDLVRPIFPVI